MLLSFETISSLTRGVAYCEQAEDGIHFHRFSKKQEALFETQEQREAIPRLHTTAGVCLEFLTDSRNLSLELNSYGGMSYHTHPQVSYSVLCNGERIAAFGSRTSPDCSLYISLSLPTGENRITVCFPWSGVSVLRSLSLDDGATVKPIPHTRRILMLGDSITHGYFSSDPRSSYASRVADALGADMRNKGIGGALFFPPLAQTPDEDFEPELITVAYGTNDWKYSSRETFDRNSTAFLQTLSQTYPKAQIFVLTPIWRSDLHDTESARFPFDHIAEQLQAVADTMPNVVAIDGFDFVPHDPALFLDGLHPNDAGFAYYAESLLEQLRTYISF